MSLNKKYTCTCKIFPEYLESHGYKRCPWCLGNGYTVHPISLEEYKGEFTNITETDTESYKDDIWVEITCECGDDVSFSEWGKQVCKCGRVYRLSGSIQKDDTHRGDFEYWKKEWEMFEGEPE